MSSVLDYPSPAATLQNDASLTLSNGTTGDGMLASSFSSTLLQSHREESQQQQTNPLTVREKIVNIFQELETTRDELRRVHTEYEKERQARLEAETEASHMRRQMQLTEVSLDNTTQKVCHVTNQLIDVLKVSEVARHACASLETKLSSVKDKEIDDEDELRKAKECNLETDKKFQEHSKKLTTMQERLERAEHRSALADQRTAALESEIRQGYAEMKSLIQAEEKAQRREEEYRKNIFDIQSRLKEAQHRTDVADVDVGKLQHTLDKLKEKLADEQNKCDRLQKMLASHLA